MTEEQTPAFVPGDEVVYVVQFNYPANVRSVSATFRNEATGAEVVLRGEARLQGTARRGTRTHLARLYYDRDPSEPLGAGRYRLARLEATTHSGKPLDFDNPPEDAFVIEDEPDESILPRIDNQDPTCNEFGQIVSEGKRGTWFQPPEGHPGK